MVRGPETRISHAATRVQPQTPRPGEPRGMSISRSRALIAFRGVRGALAAAFADKTALKAAVLNCLSAVASGANRCATDTKCANPSSSRSGTAGCDDPGTSRCEYRPETSPPAAHDLRGSLGDGQTVGGFRRSGRSSVSATSRLHLRWTRVSLVVLALLAQIVAPGTLFAVAVEPGDTREFAFPSAIDHVWCSYTKVHISDQELVFLTGGFACTSIETYAYGNRKKHAVIVDIAAGTSRMAADKPTATNGHQALFYDGKVYTFTGETYHVDNPTNTVEIYDLATDTWSTGPSYPIALSAIKCAISESVVVCAGGYKSNKFYDSAYKINLASSDPAWETLPSLRDSRVHHGIAAANGYIYVIAGYCSHYCYASTVEVLDVNNPTSWLSTSANTPDARMEPWCTSTSGKVYCIGGVVDSGGRKLERSYIVADAANPITSWTKVDDTDLGTRACTSNCGNILSNTENAFYSTITGLTLTSLTSSSVVLRTIIAPPAPCDASGTIANGAPGSGCTSTLADGASCTPTCNSGYTLSGTRSCTDGTLTDTAVCNPNSCDASGAISNGAAGPGCTSTLAHGSSCTPSCNDGYTLSGQRSCSAGTLTNTAVCNGNDCTVSRDDPNKNGDDGVFYCINNGTVSGTTGSCMCTGCKSGYGGASCDTAGACSASSDSSKDGSDGSVYCINGGTVGGSAGSCTCTCKPGYEGSGCETASACTASSNSTKDGSDGTLHCSAQYGTIGGTTGSCTCTCKAGYGGNGCETVGACSASSNSTKDGSDGIFYCINGGTVGGSAGSCECTCKPEYEGKSCQTAKSCTTEQYFDGSACQACPIFSSSTGGTSTSCTCAANTFASKSGNTWSCANCTVGATKAAGSVVPGTGGGEKEKDVCTASPTPPTETEKEKAEKTRDAMLSGIKDEKMKKKAKLLADAATTGKKVRKMSAKLTAPDEDTACSDYYAKAGLSSSLGACIATVASRRRGRALTATTYDVSVFFSDAEVDDSTLTAATNALKAEGVSVEINDVDPIVELGAIEGVDSSTLETFKAQATAAAATMPPSPPPPPVSSPPPPPPPPPPPDLIKDEDDAAATPRDFLGALLLACVTLLLF